jgi:hypothetical protein
MKKIIFLIIILGSGSKVYSQKSWQLVKDKEGIKVYVNEASSSAYFSFKAVMSVKNSKVEIINVLKDVSNYPKWFAFTASAKLIDQTTSELRFSMETDYPWPYSNECMNYTMDFGKIGMESQKIIIMGISSNTECKYSLKKGNGYILLEPDNGNTKITYCFHSEPSQSIPVWLINPRIHEMPFRTFVSLRKRLTQK